jgi:hypothetical protein
MSRPRLPVPSYRRNRSGKAVVTVYDADGKRREHRLGKWQSKESFAEYERIEAKMRAGAAPLAADDVSSVGEVLNRYRKHARAY